MGYEKWSKLYDNWNNKIENDSDWLKKALQKDDIGGGWKATGKGFSLEKEDGKFMVEFVAGGIAVGKKNGSGTSWRIVQLGERTLEYGMPAEESDEVVGSVLSVVEARLGGVEKPEIEIMEPYGLPRVRKKENR